MRRFLAYIICLVCLICTSCANTSNDTSDNLNSFSTDTPLLTVSVINVGKADSILIQTSTHSVLIDTGTSDMDSTILDYLSECGVSSLDYLIITHFHKDHCGSAAKIIKKLDVKNILQPNYDGENDESKKYVKAADKKNIVPEKITDDYTFSLDDVAFTVSAATKESFDDFEENDRSLVTSVQCGEKSFLFAADIDEGRISQILDAGISHYDFLKVAHHGFYAKNNAEFIKAVSPEFAAISNISEENADAEVFDALDEVGAQTFITSHGTIKAVCDGNTIQVSYI